MIKKKKKRKIKSVRVELSTILVVFVHYIDHLNMNLRPIVRTSLKWIRDAKNGMVLSDSRWVESIDVEIEFSFEIR